ncbi:MAG: hypothetical protein M3232_00900 [Thermoproteota archaeon]|nr:hypothetical protein [Thermoproteota archaeon]
MDITEIFDLRAFMNPNYWKLAKNMSMEVSMKFPVARACSPEKALKIKEKRNMISRSPQQS